MDGGIQKPHNQRNKSKETREEKKKLEKIVDHERNVRRSTRNKDGLASAQMDEATGNLARRWKGLNIAGRQSAYVDLDSGGAHSCIATAELHNNKIIRGTFNNNDCHAEMDVLQNVIAAGYQLDDIVEILIEKQPCPRCAVVLNKLNLQNLVRYKKAGQKDYPTWRYPKLGRGFNWAVTMGVYKYAKQVNQQEHLLQYFCTNKWWS